MSVRLVVCVGRSLLDYLDGRCFGGLGVVNSGDWVVPQGERGAGFVLVV